MEVRLYGFTHRPGRQLRQGGEQISCTDIGILDQMAPEPLPAERLLSGRFGNSGRKEWMRHQGVEQVFVYGSAPSQPTPLIVLQARLEATDSRINQCIGWSCIAGQGNLRTLPGT